MFARRILSKVARAPAFAPRALPQRSFHASSTLGFQIKSPEDVEREGNRKVADTGTWESRRYYLRKDGLGFSFHHTILYAGKSTLIWYKNHVEAVFIFKGTGTIEIVQEGQKEGEGVVHKLYPGACYALDGHERHYLRADPDCDLEVACAFNPPVDGKEDHDEHGVYPVIGEDGIPRY